MLRDLTPSSMSEAGVKGATNFSREATSSLHAHSEDCFGAAGRPRASLFGLIFGDMTPGNMAEARVLRHNQLLLGSNQQSSCPLARLLRCGWTPMSGHFWA